MKKCILVCAAAIVSASLLAQSLKDGIKMLSYGKNKSAKEIFGNLYESSPKNPKYIYWYGRALLALDNFKDVTAAKNLYQKALNEGVNDPLLLVGMGNIDLLAGDGDINAAKQKFETALTQSMIKKNKPNVEILKAIGRANADGNSKHGDPEYAIEKLHQAADWAPTDDEPYIDMGICYLKMSGHGGDAVKSFREAGYRNSKNPLSYYKIGGIYLTQANFEPLKEQFDKVLAIDSAFPMVYRDYFDYYQNIAKDTTKAKENLEQYIRYADKDVATQIYYAHYLAIIGKYQESLDKIHEIESSPDSVALPPSIDKITAYNYLQLQDSLQAKAYIENYFSNVQATDRQPMDYDYAGKILIHFPESHSELVQYLTEGITTCDTTKEEGTKLALRYMSLIADIMKFDNNYKAQLEWLQKEEAVRGGLFEIDYYTMITTAVKAQDINYALNTAKRYIQAYPNTTRPVKLYIQTAFALDPGDSTGAAREPLQYLDTILYKDSIKYKNDIYTILKYKLSYYNDYAFNYPAATAVADSVINLFKEGPVFEWGKAVKNAIAENSKPDPKKKSSNKPRK